jgi:hypothetical protein
VSKLFAPVPREKVIEQLKQHLYDSDTRAAVVVGLNPLRIAAYTDELDCVALLRFDNPLGARLVLKYELGLESRLVTSNAYGLALHCSHDLWEGPRSFGRWARFWPIIAEFVSDDMQRIKARREEIDEGEWTRTRALGERVARTRAPSEDRDGPPLLTFQ